MITLRHALPLLALFGSVLLSSCGEPAWEWSAQASVDGVLVESDRPLLRVELRDGDDRLLAARRLPRPLTELDWPVALPAGDGLTVVAHSGVGLDRTTVSIPPRPKDFQVFVEAPLGQVRRRVRDGESVEFGVVAGLGSQVGVHLVAERPGKAELVLCGRTHALEARVPGELIVVTAPLPEGADCPATMTGLESTVSVTLRPIVSKLTDAAGLVNIERIVFPADARGEPDRGRREGRIILPSPAVDRLLRASPLGVRSRAVESPWGYQAVHVRNQSDESLNAVVRATVLHPGGEPAHPFRSRLRRDGSRSGGVSVLLRIPAGGTEVANLPLFVDPTDSGARPGGPEPLPSGASDWRRRIELIPLGSEAPLRVDEGWLYVQRGSSWTAVGFAGVLVSMLLGFTLLLFRLGPWIRRSATSDLVTVALFANLMFLFSAASHVLGLGVSSLLGPFATLLTGLVDDVFRYALLATLVTLLPRPGVVTMTLLVHTVMRTLALGGFHPALPFLLGSTVLWLELFLWLSGVTRGEGAWREESDGWRWLRLSAAFGPPAVINGAVSLVTGAVLYRLYYADWYVVLMLGVPGLLYTVLACRLALGFAESLRRVEA